MNGLNYLLQTNFYLMLFIGFYVLVLRNETFFRQNRFFLNTSIFLSFLIPFINSDWFRDLFITQRVREAAIMPTQMMYETIIVGASDGPSTLSVSDALFWVYTSGATFLLLRFVLRLIFLKSRLQATKGSAFSFFNTLVVDKEIPKAETIIGHEKVHMRQWHSADIIFIELAAIVNWFNPVMYLYKKEIRHIHEFIADEEAATLMDSKSDYAMLLFSNTLGVDPLHLSNNFFNKSLLKRRILMLHKNRSRSTGLWKYGFSAPLFILMLIVSAAAASSENNLLSIDSERTIKPIENIAAIPIPEIITGKPGQVDEDNNSNLEKGISNRTFLKSMDPIAAKPASKAGEENSASLLESTIQDRMPSFPGGMKAWEEYLLNTVKYPTLAKSNNVKGIVSVSFTVEKDGSLGDIKVVRGIGSGADEEAIRVIAQSPKWNPATVDGKPVRVSYNVNINFGFTSPAEMSAGRAIPEDVFVFNTVEVLPEFEGGMAGWGKYISANLKYPEVAKKNNLTGRVIMGFIVEKDGTLSDIKVLRGIGGGADEEAVRVLKNSPTWKPGRTLDGSIVRVAYTMPIFFQLASNKNGTSDDVRPAAPSPPRP